MRRGLPILVLLALIASVGLIATAGSAAKREPGAKPSAQLRKALTNKGIFTHLNKLQAIADNNGGNRAAGSKGFDKSADYVANKLESYGWLVKRQPFDFEAYFQDSPSTFEQVTPNAATYEEDTDYSTMAYSGSGDVTAELVAVDLTLPPTAEPSSTSGCEASDFTGLNITGKIALIQRGGCDFVDKVQNAADAGAVGSVIFNEGQPGREDVVFGTLGTLAEIPALDTSFALGNDLSNGVENGATGTTVHIVTDTHSEMRSAENVIAQSPKGDRSNVVMAGAHLDSVDAGPGINDNGSGSATLLEIAHQISKLNYKPEQRIRLAWWGAEEEGLVGSTHYVEQLSNAAGAKIALYLNFDMIASPNFARLIYDGNGSRFEDAGPEGSGAIERTFERYFESQDLASGQTAFDGRSDYGPFIDVGIPAGGLFTGAEEVKTDAQQAAYGGTAGEAFDPCYHQACDDIDNISRRGLNQMSDATAHSIVRYAESLKFIPRPETKATRLAQRHGHTKYLGEELQR